MNRNSGSDPATGPLVLRGVIGGVLMGLANLVPGISGGTMLVATGIYTGFISAIAELSTFKFQTRSILLLGSVVGAAFAAIALLAGPMASLVLNQPTIMFSLFVGLTLAGVPLIRAMLGKADASAWIAGVVMFGAMAALAWFQSFGSVSTGARDGFAFMLIAGLVAAAAMVLPGVSGGYMLLVLGVYVTILRGVEATTDAVKAGDIDALMGPLFSIILPVGIGVVIGVVGVSNLLKWLLQHHRKATLGALVGLLLGAVVGLWPFQQPVPADELTRIKGQTVHVVDGVVTFTDSGEPVDADDLPRRPRLPHGPGEAGLAIGLIVVGFAVPVVLGRRLGTPDDDAGESTE